MKEIDAWQAQCHADFQLTIDSKHADTFFAAQSSLLPQETLISALTNTVASDAALKKQELRQLKATQREMKNVSQAPLAPHQDFHVETNLGKMTSTAAGKKRKATTTLSGPAKKVRRGSGKNATHITRPCTNTEY